MIMRRKGLKIQIIETGEIFESLVDCADYLGVNVTWLGHVVRGERKQFTVHGYHIVKLDSDNDSVNKRYSERKPGRPGSKVRIVETGEIFDSVSDCAKSINGSIGTIFDVMNDKRGRKIHKGYHFERVD